MTTANLSLVQTIVLRQQVASLFSRIKADDMEARDELVKLAEEVGDAEVEDLFNEANIWITEHPVEQTEIAEEDTDFSAQLAEIENSKGKDRRFVSVFNRYKECLEHLKDDPRFQTLAKEAEEAEARIAFEEAQAKRLHQARKEKIVAVRTAEAAGEETEEVPCYKKRHQQHPADVASRIGRFDIADAIRNAIDGDLEEMQPFELHQLFRLLDNAMKETKPDSRDASGQKKVWVFYGELRNVMRAIKDDARQIENNKNERQALYFIAPMVQAWKSLRTCKPHEGAFREIEWTLQRCKPAKDWKVWFLQALERLIQDELAGEGEENAVKMAFNDPDIAGELASESLDGHRATALIDLLYQGIPALIASGRQELAKARAQHATKKAERSQADREFRNSVKGHNPSADSFKKSGNQKKR